MRTLLEELIPSAQAAELEAAIKAGIEFLSRSQRKDGAFPLLVEDQESCESLLWWESTFAPAFISIALRNSPSAAPIIDKSATFLRNHADPGYRWRFGGSRDPRDPDLDDTALALVALANAEGGSSLPNSFGLYLTEVPARTYFRSPDVANSVDRVVNANVLLAADFLHLDTRALRRWLFFELSLGSWQHGSHYYTSPVAFLHSLARASSVHEITSAESQALQSAIKPWLGQSEQPLHLALCTTAWLLSGGSLQAGSICVKKLLEMQGESGEWTGGSFIKRRTRRIFYGDVSIATACAVEALGLWMHLTRQAQV